MALSHYKSVGLNQYNLGRRNTMSVHRNIQRAFGTETMIVMVWLEKVLKTVNGTPPPTHSHLTNMETEKKENIKSKSTYFSPDTPGFQRSWRYPRHIRM